MSELRSDGQGGALSHSAATCQSLASSPCWMATVTSGGRINVPANSSVVRIGCGLCMRVAVDAGKYRVVGGVRMAVPASGPDFSVVTEIYRELGMGESGSGPGGGGVTIRAGCGESGCGVVVVEHRIEPIRGGVADGAIGGEPGGNVVRIGGLVVLGQVATGALRRGIHVVVVHVTLRAVRIDVGAGERELSRVVVEGGR